MTFLQGAIPVPGENVNARPLYTYWVRFLQRALQSLHLNACLKDPEQQGRRNAEKGRKGWALHV